MTQIINMSNSETAAHLRQYVEQEHSLFSWPTDACGYEQHIKFVNHRNKHWEIDPKLPPDLQAWKQFVINYANSLEPQQPGEIEHGRHSNTGNQCEK